MRSRLNIAGLLGGALMLSACAYYPPTGQAYWQRVEDHTAMYMTGPKAQQQLDEDIASCVREVDELVELSALRERTPPDTHTEYHRALQASGDLDYYDTPTRYGVKNVSHKDFQDFEGCMRHAGWERVRFVRYATAMKSKDVYQRTRDIRKWGGVPGGNEAAHARHRRATMEMESDFSDLNR